MAEKRDLDRDFRVSVKRDRDSRGHFQVSYSPRLLSDNHSKKRTFTGSLAATTGSIEWQNAPSKDSDEVAEFEQDARRRAAIAQKWLTLLDSLVAAVLKWVGELGWSTKIISLPLEDSEIGRYEAPALLFQEEGTKVLLEPIARSTPGSEGVVDLYVMPAYDDIASLYYHDGRWHIHYAAPDERHIRDDDPRPLTKANLRKVLEEMRQHVE